VPYTGTLGLALQLANSPELDVLFEEDIRFADLAAKLPSLVADGATGLCHRIDYGPRLPPPAE